MQTELKVNIVHQSNEDDVSTPGPVMFFSPCYKPQLIQQNIRKGKIMMRKKVYESRQSRGQLCSNLNNPVIIIMILNVRVKIVSADVEVEGSVEQPGAQDPLNSNLQLDPGVSQPESKTERLSCHQQAIIVCCLLTFYSYCL